MAVLAWVYDLTAQGLRRTADIPLEQDRAPVPVGRYLQLVGALRALLAGGEAFDGMLPELVSLPLEQFTQFVRYLRAGNPARYRRYLEALAATPTAPMRPAALGEGMRLDIAEGWASRADSMLEAGVYPADYRGALGLWQDGGPAVASWAERARAGLAMAR